MTQHPDEKPGPAKGTPAPGQPGHKAPEMVEITITKTRYISVKEG